MTNTDSTPDGREGDPNPGRSLTLGDVFTLLSNSRRRQILYRLYDSRDGEVTFDDVVDHIYTVEREQLEGQVPLEYRDNVARMLHHVDLPHLDSYDVVEWNPSTETVRYLGRYPLDEWLEQARVAEDAETGSAPPPPSE